MTNNASNRNHHPQGVDCQYITSCRLPCPAQRGMWDAALRSMSELVRAYHVSSTGNTTVRPTGWFENLDQENARGNRQQNTARSVSVPYPHNELWSKEIPPSVHRDNYSTVECCTTLGQTTLKSEIGVRVRHAIPSFLRQNLASTAPTSFVHSSDKQRWNLASNLSSIAKVWTDDIHSQGRSRRTLEDAIARVDDFQQDTCGHEAPTTPAAAVFHIAA